VKVLTLTQPWATLVAIGEKRIETRSWQTSYRGPLAIHAAQGFPADCREISKSRPFCTVLRKAGYLLPYGEPLPLGQIIAVVDLQDCQPTCIKVGAEWHRSEYAPSVNELERTFGNYKPGRWMWLLLNVRRLGAPIPAKGKLSLWEYPDDLIESGLG